MDQVDASLKRLGLDHVDLYQIHGFDPSRRSRRRCARSTTACRAGRCARRLLEPGGLADHEGAGELRAHGSRGSKRAGLLLDRGARTRARDPAARRGSGPRRHGVEPARRRVPFRQVHARKRGDKGSRRADFDFPPVDKERAYDIIDAMAPIADAHDASVARVALAWLLQRKGVMSVIIGAKTVQQLQDNLAAAELRLGAEEIAALDTVSALRPNIRAGCSRGRPGPGAGDDDLEYPSPPKHE